MTLTPYTGPAKIESCGAVIDSKEVLEDLLIEAGSGTDLDEPCVTIESSLVHGVIFAEQPTYGPVLRRRRDDPAPRGVSGAEPPTLFR